MVNINIEAHTDWNAIGNHSVPKTVSKAVSNSSKAVLDPTITSILDAFVVNDNPLERI